MKEYTWKFSDEYKTALNNSTKEVETWMEHLKEVQSEIQKILNNTGKSDEQKQNEMDEVMGLEDYNYYGLTSTQKQDFNSGLRNNLSFLSEEDYDKYLDDYTEYIEELQRSINENNDKIRKIQTNASLQNRELTQEEYEEIQKIQEDSASKRVAIENRNYSDILQGMDEYYKGKEIKEEKYGADDFAITREYLDQKKKANEDYYENAKQLIENDTTHTQEWRDEKLKALEEEMESKSTALTALEHYYNERAICDENYAKEHGLTTQALIEDGEVLGKAVMDEQGSIQGMYFETEESLRKYADTNGLTVEQIIGQDGNMVSVITDGNGKIIGSVDSVQDKYSLFANDVADSLSDYTGAVNSGKMTTDEAMSKIQQDLADGKISAENFGMTEKSVA